MFPQSELDNYKLQVELLQEKLQKSEISRQQLEHKLDKILQKRDEHDKLMRLNAKQKYQQFLEEQQRRNERNKQLIQMLERIEQQTEAMNARSERLKMMKLQYEMYFAKMVHSQTRRCIQNSISPITQMMPTTSHQYVTPQNLKQNVELSPVMESYNYVNNVDDAQPQLMVNSYQQYVTNPKIENEQLLRTSTENIPMEMPTLTNFARVKRNDYSNLKNFSVIPTTTTQQPYQYQENYEIINSEINPNSSHYNRQEIPGNSISSPTINTSNMSLSSETNLLPKNKQLSDIRETLKLSSPISSTFDETSNVNMIPQNMNKVEEVPNTTFTITNMQQDRNSNAAQLLSGYIQPVQVKIQNINQTPLASINQKPEVIKQKENINNTLPKDIRNDIKNSTVKAVNEVKPEEVTKLVNNSITPLELEPSKSEIKTSTTITKAVTYVKNRLEPNEQINTNTSVTISNTETDTSATPVSIENIENAIYGELLSPLETEVAQKPENSIAAPKLLENLVTQPENLGTEINPLKDSTLQEDNVPDNTIINNNETTEIVEHIQDIQNYEQTETYDDYNNVQQSSDNTNNEYPNYENVEGANDDESQQQQQQEYDYSNYDPTQYSYPGYIYDETTGEYKPDPNGSTEQYAIDQQYSTEPYDQQYQQQDVYDYNQTYEQDPNTSTASVENTDYNNYEISQEDNSSNNIQDNNVLPQETIAEPEPIQSEINPEEIPQTSTKITKPTSILSSTDKNDSQKKKKRVNFVDSSETDESAFADKVAISNNKNPTTGNVNTSGESDFDFSSSTESEVKITT
ncbi:uncharacterized protein ACRADG_005867 [Cochliomyia hominivorax]